MKKETLSKRIGYAGLALWFALIGCGLLNTTCMNELKTETQSVDLESASTARELKTFYFGDSSCS